MRSAPHYAAGRLPYPPGLVEALRVELGLDGTGRLLDVGCGPGSLTLHLGPVRRAGRGVLPDGTRSGEEDVMREAGFTGPRRLENRWGRS